MLSPLKLSSVSIRQPLVKHRNKLPREVLESPSLDRFQTQKQSPKQPEQVDPTLSTSKGPFQAELLYDSIDYRNSVYSKRIYTILFGTQNRCLPNTSAFLSNNKSVHTLFTNYPNNNYDGFIMCLDSQTKVY